MTDGMGNEVVEDGVERLLNFIEISFQFSLTETSLWE